MVTEIHILQPYAHQIGKIYYQQSGLYKVPET